MLQHIRNVPWEFSAELVPDFELGEQTCALYVSLRFFMVHTKYLFTRMEPLRGKYRCRILLCHVDIEDVPQPLEQVTKIAFLNDWSLICAWSHDEAARYLETFKMYENKPADLIMGERTDESDQKAQFGKVLLKIKGVNRTDVATLASTFGTFNQLARASMEDLALCAGLGEKKVKRIYDAFHQPFLPGSTATSTVCSTPEARR